MLTSLNIKYKEDPNLVRGLDYYTDLVFEFTDATGQCPGALGGGGRYNNLVEEVGGKPTPAVGFGLGLERLLLVLENTNNLEAQEECTDVYIAPMGEKAEELARKLVFDMRNADIKAETDIMNRGLKAQMKYADRTGAKYVCVLGDDEIEKGVVNVKRMSDSVTEECRIDELCRYFEK